jgi:hypothetical protein
MLPHVLRAVASRALRQRPADNDLLVFLRAPWTRPAERCEGSADRRRSGEVPRRALVYGKFYTHREDALRDLGLSEDALEPIAP